MEQERERELEYYKLSAAYWGQNRTFADIVYIPIGLGEGTFQPIYLRHPHIDGISIRTYSVLVLYKHETGNDLTYEDVIDYFSQEFEDDGEIRIFTNGRHPEIYDYIVWMDDPTNDYRIQAYFDSLVDIWLTYAQENNIPSSPTVLLPVSMIDEIIKKVFDPDYELDLTSIVNRYIAEGRAVVSDDGATIEFIVPEH